MRENDIEPTPSNRVENFFNAKLSRGEPPADEFTRIEKYLSYMVGSAESYPENANTELEVWLKALCKSGILVPITISTGLEEAYINGGVAIIRHTYNDIKHDTLCVLYRPNYSYQFRAVGAFYETTSIRILSIIRSDSSVSVKTCPFVMSGGTISESGSTQSYEILSAYKIV